jgi:VCBS repeat-containing protein
MTPGISGQLVATDPDPDASLTYSLDEPIAGLAINPDGSYTFAPSDPVYLSLGEGEILAVIANWTVTDNKGATASSTLTITVNGSAPPPLEIVNLTANITSEGFNSFTITFSSLPGRGYAAERSSDLIHWNRLRDIIGDEITTDFTDNDPILDGQSVFYRVKEISP